MRLLLSYALPKISHYKVYGRTNMDTYPLPLFWNGSYSLCLFRNMPKDTVKNVCFFWKLQAMSSDAGCHLPIRGSQSDGEFLPVPDKSLKLEFIGRNGIIPKPVTPLSPIWNCPARLKKTLTAAFTRVQHARQPCIFQRAMQSRFRVVRTRTFRSISIDGSRRLQTKVYEALREQAPDSLIYFCLYMARCIQKSTRKCGLTP